MYMVQFTLKRKKKTLKPYLTLHESVYMEMFVWVYEYRMVFWQNIVLYYYFAIVKIYSFTLHVDTNVDTNWWLMKHPWI